jgi:hypothetical protein
MRGGLVHKSRTVEGAGIAVSLHGDRGEHRFDDPEALGRQRDGGRALVLLHALRDIKLAAGVDRDRRAVPGAASLLGMAGMPTD